MRDGKRYLGYVDLYGTYLEDNKFMTGFAKHICGHIISTKWDPECDRDTAINVIKECFAAVFARHTKADDTLEILVINDQEARVDQTK